MATNREKHKIEEERYPKNQINLNPIRRLFGRLFENPQGHIEPYVTNGQVVADLGCGSGYYTLALAECVGPKGKVYAVDFNEKAIRALEEKATNRGYHNIEAHATSAHNLSFIKRRRLTSFLPMDYCVPCPTTDRQL